MVDSRRTDGVVILHLLPMWCALAHAAGGTSTEGHTGSGDSMLTVLFLLGVVGGAYLLARSVVGFLQQRLLFVSGLEYVLLGVLLGPWVFAEVHPFADLTALGPVFAFAAGWVGLLYGLELPLSQLTRMGRALRLAAMDVLITGGVVTGVAAWFFQSGLLFAPVDPAEAWMSAGVLGCAAAAGSSSAVDLLDARYGALETELLPLLRQTARLGDLLAICAFGTLFCWFHQGGTMLAEPPDASSWFLLTVGLGLVLGLLFFTFIGSDSGENDVFLAMVGILLFASGAAFFVNLSALLVNLVLGVVLAQTRHGKRVHGQLERTEKPASLILLLFAGAMWRPVDPMAAVVIALGFIGLRLVGKVLAITLASLGTPLRTDLFRGLMAQGDVAVAIALSFELVYDGVSVDLAYTAILSGVVVNELVAPRLLRGLLVDAGELRQDLGPEGT